MARSIPVDEDVPPVSDADRLRALADERAALLRVAELMARVASPAEVFGAAAREASRLLGGRAMTLVRFDGDRELVVVASQDGPATVGDRIAVEPDTLPDRVLRRAAVVRVDDYVTEPDAELARSYGLAAAVAAPIALAGTVWGMLTATSPTGPLPRDTDDRLDAFAQLVAAAVGNAETNAKLTASRARVVATADETRRRLQRDVHDGAQQRLVHALIALKVARTVVEVGSTAAGLVEEALANVERASSELRDVVRGILPTSLTHGGLRVGLESLVADLALPVDLHITAPRLPAATETTAYFVVAEALTNAVKHSRAREVRLNVDLDGDTLVVEIRDDGVGGANPARGTGLTGLVDRVDALDGTLLLTSTGGEGTTLRVTLPLNPGHDVVV